MKQIDIKIFGYNWSNINFPESTYVGSRNRIFSIISYFYDLFIFTCISLFIHFTLKIYNVMYHSIKYKKSQSPLLYGINVTPSALFLPSFLKINGSSFDGIFAVWLALCKILLTSHFHFCSTWVCNISISPSSSFQTSYLMTSGCILFSHLR